MSIDNLTTISIVLWREDGRLRCVVKFGKNGDLSPGHPWRGITEVIPLFDFYSTFSILNILKS